MPSHQQSMVHLVLTVSRHSLMWCIAVQFDRRAPAACQAGGLDGHNSHQAQGHQLQCGLTRCLSICWFPVPAQQWHLALIWDSSFSCSAWGLGLDMQHTSPNRWCVRHVMERISGFCRGSADTGCLLTLLDTIRTESTVPSYVPLQVPSAALKQRPSLCCCSRSRTQCIDGLSSKHTVSTVPVAQQHASRGRRACNSLA